MNKILNAQQINSLAIQCNGLLPKDARRIYNDNCKPKIVDGKLNIDVNCETNELKDNVSILKQSFKHYSVNPYRDVERLNKSILWFWT